MTTEPRQEAERVVSAFEIMPSRQECERFGTTDRYDAARRKLVDALAAAIELHDSAVGRNNRGQWEYVEASEEQMQALSEALSALREDET